MRLVWDDLVDLYKLPNDKTKWLDQMVRLGKKLEKRMKNQFLKKILLQ